MIEMYAFIAAFTAQIIFFSVLGPLRVTAVLREQIRQFIAEQAPPIDPEAASRVDRSLLLFSRLGLATAVVGLLLLAAMIRYMLRPDWTDGPLEAIVPFYFMLQVLPTALAVATAGLFHAELKRSLPQAPRKALLQPRGLFDFVSRTAVALAIVAYCLYIALLLYIEQHPFPHFAGFVINAAMVTLQYAVVAFGIYWTILKMASSPLQAREDRMRAVGVAIRVAVYICILSVAGISLNMTLILLDEQRWEPTFQVIGLILFGVLARMALREQMRIPGAASPATSALAH
jgi:sterol desaturase/sphingolipid hydroxylase (fatty acid hydroxylase superfamily)